MRWLQVLVKNNVLSGNGRQPSQRKGVSAFDNILVFYMTVHTSFKKLRQL